jgi:hypothetical protein
MSRFERDDQDIDQAEEGKRASFDGGRVGGGSDDEDRRTPDSRNPDSAEQERIETVIAGAIDVAAAGKPTLSEFVARLEQNGVQVIPSIQTSGRLNGMSYRFNGNTVKGSRLGREYTAQGLQQRKGVAYVPERDDPTLHNAAERAGVHRADRSEIDRAIAPQNRRVRDQETGLNVDQKGTLSDIGRFRTVNVEDLIRHRYAGNAGNFDRDMRALVNRGFARRRSVVHAKSGTRYQVAVLTQAGRNFLRKDEKRRGDGAERQNFYAGFVKPAEVRHDIGIYRMYQVEAARIEREGGTVKRVALDFELKKQVFGEMNKGHDRSDPDYESRKRGIAEQHGLHVHDGRIVFPDLRIEYETRDQEMDKVDLELATGDYKASQVRAKHSAGLKIYAPDTAVGSPALQQQGLIAELISL